MKSPRRLKHATFRSCISEACSSATKSAICSGAAESRRRSVWRRARPRRRDAALRHPASGHLLLLTVTCGDGKARAGRSCEARQRCRACQQQGATASSGSHADLTGLALDMPRLGLSRDLSARSHRSGRNMARRRHRSGADAHRCDLAVPQLRARPESGRRWACRSSARSIASASSCCSPRSAICARFPAAALHMDAVRLMTVHGSKGLEFEAVHVPGLNGGSFPSSNTRPALPATGRT